MSNMPFGFGPSSGGDDPGRGTGSGPGGGSGSGSGGGNQPSPQDPFGGMFGPTGSGDIGAMFTRLGQLLSWSGGPVNWDLARDVARQTVTAAGDRSVGGGQRAAAEEALRLAELWLDPATALPASTLRAVAWSRAEWVEETLPAWKPLVEPVAGRVVEAMGSALSSQLPGSLEQLPPEMRAMAGAMGPMLQMMRSMGGAMFGAQIGQAIGSLATEVVGSTDIGLPLAPPGRAALLPANVAAFGEGLGVPEDQVRLYLALREAAHHRLFGHAPWLRDRLTSELTRYAQEISIDTSRIEEAIGSLDPTDPAALQEALGGGLFAPEQTPEQKRVLARLEAVLALIEGWGEEVVDAAATPHLPSAGALREAVRRRRATGGPAEQTFASLVGLELRPRRSRDAAALWRAVLDARGLSGRDAIWDHPDYLPGAEDLDDPAGFAAASATDALDLSQLSEPGPREAGVGPPDSGHEQAAQPDGAPELDGSGSGEPGGTGGPEEPGQPGSAPGDQPGP